MQGPSKGTAGVRYLLMRPQLTDLQRCVNVHAKHAAGEEPLSIS